MWVSVCDARGCCEKNGLIEGCNSWFCGYHISEIRSIRRRIKQAKEYNLIHIELRMRIFEKDFRKYTDEGHEKQIEILLEKCVASSSRSAISHRSNWSVRQ